MELPGLFPLPEELQAAHVLQLFPGFDRAVEVRDAARQVGVLGQEGLTGVLRFL